MEAVVKSKAVRRLDYGFYGMCALASLAMTLVWGAAMYLAVPEWGLWSAAVIFLVCYVVLVMMGRNSDWTVDDF